MKQKTIISKSIIIFTKPDNIIRRTNYILN